MEDSEFGYQILLFTAQAEVAAGVGKSAAFGKQDFTRGNAELPDTPWGQAVNELGERQGRPG